MMKDDAFATVDMTRLTMIHGGQAPQREWRAPSCPTGAPPVRPTWPGNIGQWRAYNQEMAQRREQQRLCENERNARSKAGLNPDTGRPY